jgi:alkylated DNA repair dioxygenase AlkB
LFGVEPDLPTGLQYEPELVSSKEERRLIEQFTKLPFKEFEFQGFRWQAPYCLYGWSYDFNGGGLRRTEDIPAFLLPVREVAAKFAGLRPRDLQQVLLIEYPSGAQIGWYRDRPIFDAIVGISLLSSCTFRLRRRVDSIWKRASTVAEPRSAYSMKSESRTEWEHSILAVAALRYSITFRNFKDTESANPGTSS